MVDEPGTADDEIIDAAESTYTSLSMIVPEGASARMDVWLAAQTPRLSRARIQALIKEGCVTCEGVPVKINSKTRAGQCLKLLIPVPIIALPQPEDIPLQILYEDRDLLVLNKPAGLVVHPAPGHATGTLVNALLHHCHDLGGVGGVARPGIVHRLDKDTSGLMMVAKNDMAMAGCVRLFQTGGVVKEYLALVHGAPLDAKGTITSLIGRHPKHRQKMAVVKRNGKSAITHYAVEQRIGELTLMSCRIETGRTHQIRVHMQSLGCPVAGDAFYGRAVADKRLRPVPVRQLLHAARLIFAHPLTGVRMDFVAPLPDDFRCYVPDLNRPATLC